MLSCFSSNIADRIVPIIPICQKDFDFWLEKEPERIKNIVSNNKFSAKPASFCLIADQDGRLNKVLLAIENNADLYSFGVLPKLLPEGFYEILSEDFSEEQLEQVAIGWGLGSYHFTKYKKVEALKARLVLKNIDRVNTVVESIFLVRDLINTPAGDLYPEKLAEVASDLAKEFKAELQIIDGEKLISDFPAVFAVGKGGKNKPLLIDLKYGNANDPKVVLVGKGVCFDSGGLQIKPSSAMPTMKKDMAGSAHALGLAKMIMALKLPINLRVIIPTVENLISGSEIKPGDIIKTRKGLTVEVNNTDAEGRLILADALTLASEWNPDLILDFATLTGASHVALGSDIVALFANDDELAQNISNGMQEEKEPVWRMPLHQPYLKALKGDISDLKNIPDSRGLGGGAITAALFLQQFISSGIKWAHFDMFAYNTKDKPARPKGGEAMCLRGVFRFLERYF